MAALLISLLISNPDRSEMGRSLFWSCWKLVSTIGPRPRRFPPYLIMTNNARIYKECQLFTELRAVINKSYMHSNKCSICSKSHMCAKKTAFHVISHQWSLEWPFYVLPSLMYLAFVKLLEGINTSSTPDRWYIWHKKCLIFVLPVPTRKLQSGPGPGT